MWKTPALFLGFAVGLMAADSHSGPTLPATCTADLGNSYYNVFYNTTNRTPYFCSADNVWTAYGGGGGGVPSGSIILTLAAACPAGFTAVAALDGKMVLGTTVAAKDVGTTGGADAITPAGTNSAPALTMNAYTPAGVNGAPGLTMNSYTPAGSNATVSFTPVGTNATSVVTPLGSVAAPVVSWPAGVPTFSGTPGAMAAHTISWPAGVPTFSGASSTVVVNHIHTQAVGTAATGSLVGYTYDASTGSSVAAGYTTSNPTVGGAASYTPAGTNAWPVGVPTENTPNFTPVGTVAWPAGVPTNTAPNFSGSSSTVAAQAFTGTPGTVPAEAFTGTPATLTGSVAAPSFSGTQATLTGSVAAPAFTGASFDNRSAYVKVLFCQAN